MEGELHIATLQDFNRQKLELRCVKSPMRKMPLPFGYRSQESNC